MAPPPYALHLLDLFQPLGPVTYRRMFGGAGLFIDGRMFAILDDETLYLKADDITRAEFEAAGMEVFVYQAKTRSVSIPYHRVPDELVDDLDDLLGWARKAVEAARRAPAPRKKAAAQARSRTRSIKTKPKQRAAARSR